MTHDGTKNESLTFNPIRVLFDFRLKKNEKRENQNVTIPYQKLFVVLPEYRTNPNIFIFDPKQNVAKNYYDRPAPWPLLGSFFRWANQNTVRFQVSNLDRHFRKAK